MHVLLKREERVNHVLSYPSYSLRSKFYLKMKLKNRPTSRLPIYAELCSVNNRTLMCPKMFNSTHFVSPEENEITLDAKQVMSIIMLNLFV
jgi:hypothetical protein